MKTTSGSLRLLGTAAALATLSFGATNLAQACSAPKAAAPQPQFRDQSGLMTVAYRPETQRFGTLVRVHDSDRDGSHDSIVGLWKFEMLSKSTRSNANPMPDGVVVDFGTTAWHSDGTELMNSGIRNPADNDICQGAWDKVGPSTFVLNHYALAWTNGSYTGPVNIRERVTVDPSGRRFSGTFTIEAYLATVTQGHEFDQTTKLVTITGTLTGARVSAD